MSRRGWILLVGATAALLVTTGTGAFSATVADRGVTVAVVDDDSAFLGFDQSTDATDGTANLSVEVTNRFPGETELASVTVTVDGDDREVGPIPSGEDRDASFSGVPCDAEVAVAASDSGVEVALNRSVEC